MTERRSEEQYEPEDPGDEAEDDGRLRWRVPALLFGLTVLSTFFVGVTSYVETPYPSAAVRAAVAHGAFATGARLAVGWYLRGWIYAVPLLAILLCHEFGHYVMARRHGVPASLPMFLPVPVPPFGTLGAVIRMRGRIRTRDALLDIGAAGPLAGLAVALPVTYLGLRWSPVQPIVRHGTWTQEGTSVLYALLKWLAKGPIPAGHDVFLHPVAMAGWVGLFVTMINLVPYGQLDGGHVAYALLGRAHDRVVRYVVWALVALGIATGLYWGTVLAREHRDPWSFGTGYTQGFNWLVFALLATVLHRGTRGRHPPTDDATLSRGRAVIAAVTLGLFALLFMPVPLRVEVFPP
jgi:membrane-associated protease RseP (regulator of RpoE activity)